MKSLVSLSKKMSVSLLVVVFGLSFVTAVHAQTTLTELGTPGSDGFSSATAINNSGQVVGSTSLSSGGSEAFLYSGGSTTLLGTLGSSGSNTFSAPSGINASGDVVGISSLSNGTQNPFLYSNGTMTNLGLGSSYDPAGVNDSGQIAVNGTAAYLDTNGTLTNLGSLGGSSTFAYGLNNSGQVVGQSNTGSSHNYAFLYSNGTMTDLGTFVGDDSVATAINASGQVVGWASINTQYYGGDAFLYSNGTMTNLGTLGGQYSVANGISNSGEIVGQAEIANGSEAAFVYTSGAGMKNLNTLYASLLVPGGGTETGFTDLTDATGVNSSGEIVGEGNYWNGTTNVQAAFLLGPNEVESVPEPSTWAMLLGGLGLLAFWYRRNPATFGAR